ncbi:hypothetical protein N431DRAFT_358608 [Stipitochalara longipes BDJ]|nr:hypothetical protein N431DRAFT_358608 [Stipitochalara longipes BDJ]
MGFHPTRNINSRVFIYFLAIPIFLLYSLALTGCISESPGIPDIFLAELISTAENNTRLRFNYFAMCSSGNSSQEWFCSSTISASSATLASTLQVPEAIVQYGLDLQSTGFPVLLAAGGIFFTTGIISFLWLKMTSRAEGDQLDNDKLQRLPKRKSRLSNTAKGSLWISATIAIVVAYANTLTLSSILLATSASHPVAIQVNRGTSLEVIQWFIFSLSFLFSLGVTRLIQRTGLEPPLVGGNHTATRTIQPSTYTQLPPPPPIYSRGPPPPPPPP